MSLTILVCVKQIINPHLDAEALPAAELSDDDYVMSRYDAYALEMALSLKDTLQDVRIEVVSIGPARVTAVLRRALAMGADHAIHVPGHHDLDPRAIATLIAGISRLKPYDLILTGVMAEDDMQGLVGPMSATLLDVPCAVAVTALTVQSTFAMVGCELEGGRTEHVELTLPALLAVQSGPQQPRYPSLSNTLRSLKQPLEVIAADRWTLPQPPSTISSIEPFRPTADCRMLSGSLIEQADALLDHLHTRGLFN